METPSRGTAVGKRVRDGLDVVEVGTGRGVGDPRDHEKTP